MDDKGDPRDEKDRLGLVATALRRSKHPLQKAAAEKLRYAPKRLSAIERGDAASREQLEDLAKRLGYRSLHLLKTLHLVEFLAAEQRKPLDPLGPTPDQEVAIYQTTRELAAEFEAICRGNIRREKLEQARLTAEAQWERLKDLTPFRKQEEVLRDPAFHTWEFVLYLCAESVRQAADDPKAALRVARLAVAAAPRVDLPWDDRLVAYALAHFANAYRVIGDHHEADKLFAKANRLWSSPDAAAADPGVLDPGRIYDLEASLRKDQRRLPEALALLKKALPISRAPGRILVSRAIVLSLMGSYEEAIATLRRAGALLDEREPRDEFVLYLNTGVNLCHLNRFNEAIALADSAFRIAEVSKNRIDVLRSRWLRARVLAGTGDRLVALSIYQELVDEFVKREMTFDLALVTLELAALLLALGRTRDCQSLVVGLPKYFEAKEIHKEALAALKVFSDSVRVETATEAFAQQVAAFLYLARGNPNLRFVPTRS